MALKSAAGDYGDDDYDEHHDRPTRYYVQTPHDQWWL